MRRLSLLLFLLLLACSLLQANAILGDDSPKPQYAPDKVKVQLTAEAIQLTNLPTEMYARSETFGIPELDIILNDLKATAVVRAHIRPKDTLWEQETGFDRWFIVEFLSEADINNAIKIFKSSSLIQEATPAYFAYPQFIPNDPYYTNNWGHNNTASFPAWTGGYTGGHTGALVGTAGFDSHAQTAWDLPQGLGNPNIIIGIMDTGVQISHPDLRLVPGYDFGCNEDNPNDDSNNKGHGTACAGIAAGIGNNALGISGIAAGCSVMPLKIATQSGGLPFEPMENALIYAADHGVDVISMSFGADAYGLYSPATDAALSYAYNNGCVLFAATANENGSYIYYPASHPDVIAVGASSPTGQRKNNYSSDGEYWWGSNYGSNTINAADAVDLMGPTILPTTDLMGANGYADGDYSMWFNGTSCATPYVAGVAALLLSRNPTLTPAQIKSVLIFSTTDMTADNIGVGWDRYSGSGMVNAQAALNSVSTGYPICRITSPADYSGVSVGSSIMINVSAVDTNPGGVIFNVKFYLDGNSTPISTDYSSPWSFNWNTTGISPGDHTISVLATDNNSFTASDQISIHVVGVPSESFESGNFNVLPWIMGGSQAWTIEPDIVYEGAYSAKSGSISQAGQYSTMRFTVYINSPGQMEFYVKTAAYSDNEHLRFYINGILSGTYTGTGQWSSHSWSIQNVGLYQFTWVFTKVNYTAYTGCAYVDHITLPPFSNAQPPIIYSSISSLTVDLETGQSATNNLLIGNQGVETLNYSGNLPYDTQSALREGFESGALPTGWTQTFISGTTNWTYGSGGYNNTHPTGAQLGSYNARFVRLNATPVATRLSSPSMNLAGAASAILRFWHTQEAWPGHGQDQLAVYYKRTSGGTWTELETYTESIATWTQETIVLPNLSSTYYIAFVAAAQYGYGVCLDQISVAISIGTSTPWITLNGTTAISGSLTHNAISTTTVVISAAGLAPGTYTSGITITSNSYNDPSIYIPVSLNVYASSPPAPPNNLVISYDAITDAVILNWATNTEYITKYNVYRSFYPDFSQSILLGYVPATETTYSDPMEFNRIKAFYRITAVRE